MSSRYTGRLVVRLGIRVVGQIAARARGDPGAADLRSLDEVAHVFGLAELGHLLRRYPPCPSYPSVGTASVGTILGWEDEIQGSDLRPPHSLTAYFLADPRVWHSPARAARFLADLKHLPPAQVDLTYRELALKRFGPSKWAVDPGDDFVPDQGYLQAAPQGIGANTQEVWGSFNGAGIGFVDVEGGWNLQHVEFPRPSAANQPLANTNDKDQADHGTSVLGIVLAQPGNRGTTGIAPAADFCGVASWVTVSDDEDLPGAIAAAIGVLKPGDVLLLEVQTGDGYPVEIDEVCYTAISAATAKEIIVIEAAGNGTEITGRDLDQPIRRAADDPPATDLNRGSPGFQDSGAIMVSACRANLATAGGHRRIGYAGSGSRIDCFAWGEKVVTTGGGDFGPVGRPKKRQYTELFGGTSAASAIVAGAALLVQQMAGPRRLTPVQMRAVLSALATGTTVLAPSGTTKVGVMPDLQAIAPTLGGA